MSSSVPSLLNGLSVRLLGDESEAFWGRLRGERRKIGLLGEV
jgi:hypothetical protein